MFKLLSFKKCIFRVSYMKDREGWTGSQAAGCLFTRGCLHPLSCPEFWELEQGCAATIPWERPCSSWVCDRIWVAFSNSLGFVLFLTFTPLFLLRELSLTSLSLHFLESESVHYGLHSAIFPQIHLEAIGSLTVGVMLFRRYYILWAVCAKAPLPIPARGSGVGVGGGERGPRHSRSFCSPFLFY